MLLQDKYDSRAIFLDIVHSHHEAWKRHSNDTKLKCTQGICGLPESVDSSRVMAYKVAKLISMIRSAKHIVGKKKNGFDHSKEND